MTSENWSRLEDLFHAAEEMNPQDRAAFLATQPAAVRARLERLLQASGSGAWIAGAVGAMAGIAVQPGSTVGAYRVERCLGNGGMGSIYLAARADEAFEKKVAVKFVRVGFDTPIMRERFESERRILARLDHPYIARLLDAGATTNGHPYFVMEYVEGGCNILQFAGTHKLDPRARVELFRKICTAVLYAHSNLVIHRDIKPGNILVAADGTPKLLDFGMAKLLDSTSQATQPIWVTPRYASPEQLNGATVTTASDIFSLGVVLREVLLEANHTGEFSTELETIVAKATRPEPAERYETVAALADDLAAFLEYRPIRARQYSLLERLVRVARRNRVATVGLFAGLLSLAAGLGLMVKSAIVERKAFAIAVAERQKAEQQAQRADQQAKRAGEESARATQQAELAQKRESEALASRELAYQRFLDSRELASGFYNDIYMEIFSLPGATSARLRVLEKILSYLEGLARQSPDDTKVQFDLARASMKLASLSAGPGGAQTGAAAPALERLQRAQAILRGLVRKQPDSLDARLHLVEVNRNIISLLTERSKDFATAQTLITESIADSRNLVRQHPQDPQAKLVLGASLQSSSFALLRKWPTQTTPAPAEEAEQVLAEALRNPIPEKGAALMRLELEAQLAQSLSLQGHIHTAHRRFPQALAAYRKALHYSEPLLQRNPNNLIRAREVMLNYYHIAATHDSMGTPQSPEARQATQMNLDMARKLATDAANSGARFDYAMALLRTATLQANDTQLEQSSASLDEAVNLITTLRQAQKDNTSYAYQLLGVLQRQGDVLVVRKLYREAIAVFQKMRLQALDYEKMNPAPNAFIMQSNALSKIALAKVELGEPAASEATGAVSAARRAFEMDRAPANEAALATVLGRAGEALVLTARRTPDPKLSSQAVDWLTQWDTSRKRLPEGVFGAAIRNTPKWTQMLQEARGSAKSE